MFDYHVHSLISFDAYDGMEKCAREALSKGFTEICFTDHYELSYPYPDVPSGFDFDRYFAALDRAREAVPGITIRAGIEAGLLPESVREMEADLSSRPLDFVIGSQHTAGGQDPYYGDLFPGRTLREAQRLYLEEMLFDLRQFSCFNVIAHIGYIDKYLDKCENPAPGDAPFQYHDFPELLDEILLYAIRAGKGIEVNTSNYYIHGYPTPHPSIIKRFFELGGDVVTIGSDAHSADVIGHNFREARDLLRECGARYVCAFERGLPKFIPIDEF